MACAPCRSSSEGARYQTFEDEGRQQGSKSQSVGSAAVPFQEVISEATAVVEGGTEEQREGGGGPDFTAKRDPAEAVASPPHLPSDQKFLVYFWICQSAFRLHGKVSLIERKSVQTFHLFLFYADRETEAMTICPRESDKV